MRELRNARRGADSPGAQVLCGDVPPAERQAAAMRVVRSALYRLPQRQREVVRRHDLDGEPAEVVQRSLGLSARQFYRDRRAGLAVLGRYLLGTTTWQRDSFAQGASVDDLSVLRLNVGSSSTAISVSNAEVVRQAYGRNLFQCGDVASLGVLRSLAQATNDPKQRAGLFLDLAEMAVEFDRKDLARRAQRTATRIVDENGTFAEADEQFFRGRIARSRANFVDTCTERERLYTQSLAHLRRSLSASPARLETRSEIALTLGEIALTKFGNGAFAEARAASAEASAIISAFELWTIPRALEIVAVNATLEAMLTGRVGVAVRRLSKLLDMAIELGWSSIVGLLGALLIGLNATRGRYEEAVRWYERLASPVGTGMRLVDRAHLSIEAAHALSMLGRSAEALGILGYRRPDNEWPRVETAAWHVSVAEALERSGDPITALAEAESARYDYEAQQVTRGLGNAHRVIAGCYGRLGDLDRAKEHVIEAQRLIETNGTPYNLLRTLVAKAGILRSPRLKSEAIEFAQMLRALDDDPAPA